jgi:predicted DNA-binding transcriptional regulator AlpA
MSKRLNNGTIPDALKNFDLLPDSAKVRLPVVQALYGCSRATVWRRVKEKLIPLPSKTKNITTWNVGELRLDLKQGERA